MKIDHDRYAESDTTAPYVTLQISSLCGSVDWRVAPVERFGTRILLAGELNADVANLVQNTWRAGLPVHITECCGRRHAYNVGPMHAYHEPRMLNIVFTEGKPL